MATTASDATPNLHSPRGSAALEGSVTAAATAGIHSPQYRRRGGVSSPWTQIVRCPDLELTLSSSSSTSPAAVAISSGSGPAAVGISVAPPPVISPSLSSGGGEEQIMSGFSSDRSPSKAVAPAGASTSFLPEDVAGEAQPESSEKSEYGSSGGSNAAKKPAWNKPSNGSTEVGPVMGAVSWPALSESTRASPKSSSDFSKTLSDGSLPVPVTVTVPVPVPIPVAVSQGSGMTSPSANKQGSSSTAHSNSTSNHPPNRQRSMKRAGGNPSNNSSSNGGISQLPSPRGSGTETTHANSGKHANPTVDSLSRDNTHRDGGQRSQSHGGNEHHQQRNSYRRGSGGPHPRGDGPHHHGYGGRRGDQERGNQDWNSNRSFGGRDAQVQQQRVATRPFIRGPPPPQPPPFITPAPIPVRPYGTPIVYPEVPSTVFYLPGPHPDSFRALSMVGPIPPMFYPYAEPQLHAQIVNQIDYYFSNENLIKDTYLRKQMDDQGWVPIKIIAKFNKVSRLTESIQIIMDALRTSSVVEVEVEGEKVRRRNDWMRWIMPRSVQYPTESSPQSFQKSSQDMLAAGLHSMVLDEKTAKHSYIETYLSTSSSGEWSSLSHQSSGEKTSQAADHAAFPLSAPNSSK